MDFTNAYQFALRVLASGLLLWIAALCGAGLYRIWWAKDLVYRSFSYERDGTDDTAAGLHFTQLVNHHMRLLHRLLSPAPGADATLVVPTVTQEGGSVTAFELPNLPGTLLPAIDIQAYGIQLSAIVNRIFQQVVPPNEIMGAVTETKGRIDAYVELHQGGPRNGLEIPAGLVMQHTDKDDAAFATACRIYRILGTQRKMIYQRASDAEFEVFARALQRYEFYRASLAEVRSPETSEAALKETERLLRGLLEQESHFPLTHKLAALVAYSKGQIRDAIGHLEKYRGLWPRDMKEDENARDLLAKYNAEAQKTAELTTTAQSETASTTERHRPVRPGISVSSTAATAGTLCCIVTKTGDPGGPRFLLSADTVLGSEGSNVLQPGTADGGGQGDVVAVVAKAIAAEPRKTNTVAGTIARLTVDALAAPTGFSFSGVGDVELGAKVRKIGRTTGLTEGTITTIETTIKIHYGDGIRTFDGLFIVEGVNGQPFTRQGDSGAPVVDEQNRLVGMAFAGSDDVAVIMPIIPLLKALNVDLVL